MRPSFLLRPLAFALCLALAPSVSGTARAQADLELLEMAGIGLAVAPSVDQTRLDPIVLEQAALLALREAIEGMSEGQSVQVDVVDLRVLPDSLSTLLVDGVARMRIEQGEWIPLRFDGGYDLSHESMFGLKLKPLSRTASGAARVIETGLEARVSGQVSARILTEFPGQAAELVFVEMAPTSQGRGHLGFHGSGLVDFADEGVAAVQFSAIVDRASGLLVALDYQLDVSGSHGTTPRGEEIAAH